MAALEEGVDLARNSESLTDDFATDPDDGNERDVLDEGDLEADFDDESDGDYDDEDLDDEDLDDDEDSESVDSAEDDDDSDEEESLEAILTKESPRRLHSDDDDEEADEIDFAGQPELINAELKTRADPLRDVQEFVCSRCHLVKARSQLADPERQLCRDCV